VVRTTPRGVDKEGKVPDLSMERLPPIQTEPNERARITFYSEILCIPD
jgi:hypothetical protein